MGRRRLLIVLLVLAAAAGGIVWQGQDEQRSEVGGAGSALMGRSGGEGPRLEADARPTNGIPSAPPNAPPTSALPVGGSVRVLVRDEDGRPIVGARARLREPGEGERRREGVTGPEGSVDFAEVEAGEAWLWVDAEGFEQGGRGIKVRPAEGAAVEIVLRRLLVVSGVVLLPDGGPAAGARVLARRGGSLEGRTELYVGDDTELAATTCGGDGTFRLPLPPGVLLTLVADSGVHAEAEQSLRLRAAVEGLVLRLGLGGVVRGRVLAADGSPAVGAEVFLVPADVPQLSSHPRAIVGPGGGMFRSSGDEEPSGGMEFEGQGSIQRARRARTDAEGRFEVAGIPLPARVRALAQGSDGARGGARSLDLSSAEPQGSTEVKLEPRVTLVVRTLGHDGAPAGGQIQLLGAREDFLDPRGEAAAGWAVDGNTAPPEARCEFTGLVGGRYPLRVVVEGCLPSVVDVDLPASGRREIAVRGRPGRSLAIFAVDPTGAPVPAVSLQLSFKAAAGIEEQSLQAFADDSGRHLFAGLQDAAGSLSVSSETHVGRTLKGVRPGPEPVRVVLEPLPLLTCRFVLDGVNLTHDYVWVEERSEGVERMHTGQVGADGVFRYRVQTVDVESLFVLSPWEGARVVLGRHRLGAGEVKDLGEVRIDGGREIRGRLFDQAGEPCPGVKVAAALVGMADEADGMRRGPPEAASDAEGRFVIRGVHRGPAVLRTKHATWGPAAQREDGGGGEVVIVLIPGAFIEGVLRAQDGVEPASAWLELEGPDGVRRIVIPEPSGALKAGPLPPGVHRVGLAGLPRARRDLGTLDLVAGETRRVEWPR